MEIPGSSQKSIFPLSTALALLCNAHQPSCKGIQSRLYFKDGLHGNLVIKSTIGPLTLPCYRYYQGKYT